MLCLLAYVLEYFNLCSAKPLHNEPTRPPITTRQHLYHGAYCECWFATTDYMIICCLRLSAGMVLPSWSTIAINNEQLINYITADK
jgi:hypothetical protein